MSPACKKLNVAHGRDRSNFDQDHLIAINKNSPEKGQIDQHCAKKCGLTRYVIYTYKLRKK